MFNPNRQQAVPGMAQTTAEPVAHTMSALAGTPRPERPTFAGPNWADFRTMPLDQRMVALQGFRDQRADYRNQVMDWREDFRDWRQQNRGPQGNDKLQQGQPLPAPAGQQIAPQPPNVMAPGMAGSSLYVRGMNPGQSPLTTTG